MIWISRNHSYEVRVLCANGLSGEVCMRKQTFLYRLDTQQVPLIQRKHLNWRARGSFCTSVEIFSGFSGMRASTTVIYGVVLHLLRHIHLLAPGKLILRSAAIITCSTGKIPYKRFPVRVSREFSPHITSSLLQESPETNYRFCRIVGLTAPAYSQRMNVALNFPTFRAGADAI